MPAAVNSEVLLGTEVPNKETSLRDEVRRMEELVDRVSDDEEADVIKACAAEEVFARHSRTTATRSKSSSAANFSAFLSGESEA